ncbi:MAG TPA: hypothetical protein VHY08_25810 [Bacillota bacterium]|nr:hypothetical protein [Bacillota bacterium]
MPGKLAQIPAGFKQGSRNNPTNNLTVVRGHDRLVTGCHEKVRSEDN